MYNIEVVLSKLYLFQTLGNHSSGNKTPWCLAVRHCVIFCWFEILHAGYGTLRIAD